MNSQYASLLDDSMVEIIGKEKKAESLRIKVQKSNIPNLKLIFIVGKYNENL